jgi:hypothetical protein
MPMQVGGSAGPVTVADSASAPMRQGRLGEAIVSALHGRFYEQNYRGNLFSGGMAATAINNATFTTATLGATCTPIFGIWNPLGSGVNAVLLAAILNAIITAATNTGAAPFAWAVQTGQGAITTGNAPLNRVTLLKAGSKVKDMSGVALTGLSANLIVAGAAALGGGSLASFSFVGTAVGQATPHAPSIEQVDGAWIVPPGGVLALLASTLPVAHSAASMGVWEEVATA